MPRNFGLRARDAAARFWNEPSNTGDRDADWAFLVIGAAVVLIVLVGIFA